MGMTTGCLVYTHHSAPRGRCASASPIAARRQSRVTTPMPGAEMLASVRRSYSHAPVRSPRLAPTTLSRAGYPPSEVLRRISIPCARAAGRSEHVFQADVAVELRLVRRGDDVPVSAAAVLCLCQPGDVGAHEEEAVVRASGQVVTTDRQVEQPVLVHMLLVAELEAEEIVRANERRVVERHRHLGHVLVRAVQVETNVAREIEAGVEHVARDARHV